MTAKRLPPSSRRTGLGRSGCGGTRVCDVTVADDALELATGRQAMAQPADDEGPSLALELQQARPSEHVERGTQTHMPLPEIRVRIQGGRQAQVTTGDPDRVFGDLRMSEREGALRALLHLARRHGVQALTTRRHWGRRDVLVARLLRPYLPNSSSAHSAQKTGSSPKPSE